MPSPHVLSDGEELDSSQWSKEDDGVYTNNNFDEDGDEPEYIFDQED